MDQSDIRSAFFVECEDLMEALNEGLDRIEDMLDDGHDDETVNAVFRAVHSIKGGAGAFKLDALVRFAHQFETTLDALRAGRVSADPPLLALLHKAADRLSDLLQAARTGSETATIDPDDLVAQLAQAAGEEEAGEADAEDLGFVPMPLDLDLPAAAPDEGQSGCYSIDFSPTRALYACGNDTSILFRVLSDLGRMEVRLDRSRLPDFDALDWQESWLDWHLTLETDEPEHQIDEVFEFVEDLCRLEIRPMAMEAPRTDPDPEPDPEPDPPASGPAAAKKSPAEDHRTSSPRATVRVELDRVDRLINIVGELVINQAMLSQCVQDEGVPPRSPVRNRLDDFRNLAREIQESVMAIRAQAIKPLFQRMSRIAREASEIAQKQIRLVTEGESTEVDKTVIERLADPLTHMIRNAVDHGIEPADRRLHLGKPPVGLITLTAAHRSGRVLIEIKDDGGGINRPRVLEIARGKGLVAPDAQLTEEEIDGLLFMPGFSTASVVSDLSGRGVGMDVVKSAIESLGGRITIASDPGVGTTFTISLPLTLAVLDGMVVDVGGQTMVVPVAAIVETLRPRPADIHILGSGDQVVAIRGSLVPIVDCGSIFGFRAPVRSYEESVLLLVETARQKLCALVVDTIHDQRQVVIKGLENGYGRIPGVAAATILGDGRIALIIAPEEAVDIGTSGGTFSMEF
ncbi:chemotaxis protein CheA [Rhodobacter sphaeroides]|jgi:Chemotaxis protein histidine kinase and related kinases|uniref:Chemotaxis protein CheA n=1 Tax=Cereibacter sphaeroides (strain ATCC 17023 / DSM 158 / JCM 6121 / CCUG 31486 / LMG 2827 / NBRC 12203 / NCIMB 8253 / ATH 2.4.1.) TaxID=272943 RepID=Q3J3N7_CERS4|nr:chemotaxis protein CheA [Cereibacter sphaeroides]ABA78597.1 Chemotaxis histidine protein kinase, CheA1 [Cereibacter sphaeroides 2.4.1]AMJ46946.1 chemotaxis protein CheA [Cereibacter sphaeroides]ANS33658.1 chemotaxis protein CheA [Cereibacter sphaeroides]ATN62702.1 chemotaxis protein CheA [Cereibacter sphaeroides]AXC60814.1 chemotaxis protein CheA [Cereibacter sphaeroides 2.4.1]